VGVGVGVGWAWFVVVVVVAGGGWRVAVVASSGSGGRRPRPRPPEDLSSIPWGARWAPARSQVPSKCHQKSTSNSAGSSVGSLAPPRATPRLGGVYVSRQYLPCSFVLALRELGLRLGVKTPLPLRASSRGVLPGPGDLAGYRTRLSARWHFDAAAPKLRPIGCDYSQPAYASPDLISSPTKSRDVT
jgi:hypothetical protein